MPTDINNLPLRDIHLPGGVSWWPLAPGWWVVILLMVLIVAIILIIKKRRNNTRVVRVALQELVNLKSVYDKQFDAKRFVTGLSALLRRVCITLYPQQEVAALTGQEWLNFLDQCVDGSSKSNKQLFSAGAGMNLISIPYSKDIRHSEVNVNELYQISERWIKNLPSPSSLP